MTSTKENKLKDSIEESRDPNFVNDLIHNAADRAAYHQKARERIGFVVFILAIIGIILGVFAYMIVGHKLDLAASGIDQSMGSLSDYAVIVFDGTASKKTIKQENRVEHILHRASDLINQGSDTETDSQEQTVAATSQIVSRIYKSKQAVVCNIHCDDLSAYNKGEVFQRNG